MRNHKNTHLDGDKLFAPLARRHARFLFEYTINPCVGRETALCGNSVNAIFGVGFHHANCLIKTNVAKPGSEISVF